MATATTIRKPRKAARPHREPARLRSQNRKLLDWLDSWLATPDDRGEHWWAEFQADLDNHRMTFRPHHAE